MISKHRHAERQGIFILTNMKTCTKCNIEKETTEFTIERRSKDGLRSSCKECDKQYYLSNKEKIDEKAKKYREQMIETAVEMDDELMEKYLAGETLSVAEIKKCIRKGTIAFTFVPIFCGAAF